jgi:hypothetical protein
MKFGAFGGDDDVLLAVEHIGHGCCRSIARERHFFQKFSSRFVILRPFRVADLKVGHQSGSSINLAYAWSIARATRLAERVAASMPQFMLSQ